MNESNDKKLAELLRKAMAPVGEAKLERDLWPRMLRKLDERAFRLVWFEWALIALVAVWLILWPEVIPVFFYQL